MLINFGLSRWLKCEMTYKMTKRQYHRVCEISRLAWYLRCASTFSSGGNDLHFLQKWLVRLFISWFSGFKDTLFWKGMPFATWQQSYRIWWWTREYTNKQKSTRFKIILGVLVPKIFWYWIIRRNLRLEPPLAFVFVPMVSCFLCIKQHNKP